VTGTLFLLIDRFWQTALLGSLGVWREARAILGGKYVLSAFIPPVNGEIDTSDNSYNAGWICVSILGDVTGPNGLPDRKVDMRDIGAVARTFGAKYPSPEYNPNYDVDDNGKIDMKDVGTVARHSENTTPKALTDFL
jgi:hypothetical protein